MEFRPARAEDFQEFMDRVPLSCKAWTAEQDGRIYGIGGVYYENGDCIAFSHMHPDIRKRDRILGARIIMGILEGVKAPVYAYPALYDTAPATLKHFGFEKVENSGWYIWRRK